MKLRVIFLSVFASLGFLVTTGTGIGINPDSLSSVNMRDTPSPRKAAQSFSDETDAMPADTLIPTEKPEVLVSATPRESWNMVTKSLVDGSVDYFYFDEHDYSYRQFAYDDNSYSLMSASEPLAETAEVHSFVNSDGSVSIYTEGYDPLLVDDGTIVPLSEGGIIGTDDRVMVEDTLSSPYRYAGFLLTIYKNVYNRSNGQYEDRSFIGTAFLEGPDLLVTAGHCVYGDVTNTFTDEDGNPDTRYEDNLSNPRFPDEIIYYPARNGNSYPYGEVDVERIYLENEYYLNVQKDWACCKLSEPIGNTTGWNGKIGNFYEQNYPMTTFGYPGDKNGYMYEVSGKMTDFESNGWYYRTDMDAVAGQSGSPYQVTVNGNDYVCGIFTYMSSDANGPYTGGCRIDSFMFYFMNSFVTGDELPEYVSLFIHSKSGSTWKIRIYNPNPFEVTAYYNSKMCFYGDAENWTGLADVKDVQIAPYDDEYVEISENWFATSIAVSILHGSKRLVTFADNLDINNKTLSLHQNLIA